MGEKTFIPPTGLHNDLRKNSLTTAIPGSSPPTQQPRWASTSKITSEGSTSTTHSPASTLSRASTLAHPSSSGVGPINIAPSRPSVQQWHAMATAATASGSSPSTSSTTPNSGTAIPAVGSIPRSTPAGPLGVGQSPNKSAWKSSDQTSPPIPIQTKPSGPGRGRSDSSAAGVSPPVAFGTTPRPSPPLKTSMSSSDIFSTVTDAPNLKSTPSISSFPKPPVPEFPPMGSRSASPSKLSFIPPKSSPAPAKVTSAQSKSYHPEAQQPSPESETAPSRRETKSKSEGRRRPKDKGKEREEEARKREQEEEERRRLEKEAEEQRKREEEEKERQRREEEEKEQIRREEEEKERARKEQEERDPIGGNSGTGGFGKEEIEGVDLRLGASVTVEKISEDDIEVFSGGLGRGVVPNATGGLTPAAELSERPLPGPDGFVCMGIGGEVWSLDFQADLLGDCPTPRGPAGVERGIDPTAGMAVPELGVVEDGREGAMLIGPTPLELG
ncbi:15629_t:CDS:2 [Acaulospora colombiana]|uniref:15629_t:CDS:1 n=1 Tax=Acaulospora colombiana TaxID=27376 RepID=A0ACA9N722_9GLOM|nr:15629_t:CDS:2 [Acaulospora colombiana]